MKKIVMIFLLLLGVAEIAWSTLATIRYHNLQPPFARAFDVSKLTADQQHVLQQLEDTTKAGWSFVFFFGLVTLIIAFFLWQTENAKKPDA